MTGSTQLSLADAIAEHVHDGDTVALEGFTHLIPFAAGQEIIRQGRRDLTLVRMTPDVIYDQMIGMGCAQRMVFSYGGNPGVGSLHRMRDAVENGWPCPLELVEHSHAGLANAYVAGASRLPFGVLRGYAGTDLEHGGAVAPRPHAVVLPSWVIAAVAHVPGGAWPSYAHDYSTRDNAFYAAWDEIARDRDRFRAWMDEHVLAASGETVSVG